MNEDDDDITYSRDVNADGFAQQHGLSLDFLSLDEAVTRIHERFKCGVTVAGDFLLTALQGGKVPARLAGDGVGFATAHNRRVRPLEWGGAFLDIELARLNAKHGEPRSGELLIKGENVSLAGVAIDEAGFAFWLRGMDEADFALWLHGKAAEHGGVRESGARPVPQPQGEAPVSIKTRRRSNGLNYADKDAPLVERMRKLIIARRAHSPEDAARAVVVDAFGHGTGDSKVKRLAKRYRDSYPDKPFE